MAVAIRINDPAWIELLATQPRVGDMLTDCMRVQPDIDPDAGFGVMQPFAMWRTLDLPEELHDKFVARMDNPYKAYVTLRGASFMYGYSDILAVVLAHDKPIPYMELAEHVAKYCNNFRVGLVAPHLNGDTVCQSATPSATKASKKRVSRAGCSPQRSRSRKPK